MWTLHFQQQQHSERKKKHSRVIKCSYNKKETGMLYPHDSVYNELMKAKAAANVKLICLL